MLIEVVLRSKRAQLFSRLEGLSYFSAPNAGNPSRVWRVVASLALQTWATFPAFVVGFASAYACALKSIIHVPHAPASRKAALTCSAAASVSASAITHPPPPPPVSFAPNAP